MLIMVNSHPRSGTHLLIDAITQNVPNAFFPHDPRLPADFNYGSLLRDDPNVNAVFAEQIERSDKNCIVIKNHLMPAAMTRAIESSDYSDETRQLLRRIWNDAIRIYIHRDPRDTLVSLYHHLRPNQEVDFSTFLHDPSQYSYKELPSDYEGYANKPRFWRAHIEDWMALVPMRVTAVAFEDLDGHFGSTFRQIMQENHIPLKGDVRKPQKQTDANRGFLGRLKHKLYRKGIRVRVESTAIEHSQREGSWETYFSPEDLALTLAEVGETMVHLGYATE